MAKYVLTKESKRDLRSIAYYTDKKWGVEQRKKYLHRLRNCFKILADSPPIRAQMP
ncbi:MAG: type II toxin-antitoxin system RelE/ParE family toxin [bacterium]